MSHCSDYDVQSRWLTGVGCALQLHRYKVLGPVGTERSKFNDNDLPTGHYTATSTISRGPHRLCDYDSPGKRSIY